MSTMLDSLGEQKIGSPLTAGALARNYYREANYSRFRPASIERMPDSLYASLVSNEVLNPERLTIPQEQIASNGALDGYLIGVGSGTIWSMLDFFKVRQNAREEIKGMISFDRDPAALLTGLVIRDYARDGADVFEVLDDIFNRKHKNKPYETDPALSRAGKIIEEQRAINPQFAEALEDSLTNLKSDLDSYARIIGNMDYLAKSYRKSTPEITYGSVDIMAALYRNWEIIKKLAQEDKMAFIHADIKNSEALQYISRELPDIQGRSNLIYVSNVLDHLKRAGIPKDERHFKELGEAIDPHNRSHYVYARNLYLDVKDTPPDWQDV